MSYAPQITTIPVPIPSALTAKYGLEGATFSLTDNAFGPAVATCSLTPEQVFAVYSTALSSPGATYYLSPTGSDSNNGLSSGAPFLSIWKAIQSANAAGVPTKVNVAGGTYYRAAGPNASNTIYPTVDIAFVATGSRVVTGAFDAYSAPSKDGTYTNTYSFARSNCDRVYDLLNVDQHGCYKPLQLVASAAICNITPGSWYTDNTTLYIQRADGAAVTNTNTRYVLNNIYVWGNPNNKNIYFGDGSAGSTGLGFDAEGGYVGGFYGMASSPPSTACVHVFVGSTFRYAGGRLGTTGRGVALDGHKGAAWFFNCDASANHTDGFNCHDSISTGNTGFVTVNCTANNNGETPAQSNNGWTHHDDCYGFDFCGRYEGNYGGTCRSINTSVGLLAGTYVKNDKGDMLFGGAIPPTAFKTDGTAVYYCFRTKADLAGGGFDYNTTSGAAIYKRDVWASRGASGGGGTLGTW